MTKKKKKKKKIIIALCSAAIALILCAAAITVFLIKRPGYATAMTPVKIGFYDPIEVAFFELDPDCIDQSMLFVNPTHGLEKEFKADLSQYEDSDVYINTCAMESFLALRSAVEEKFGTRLRIMSGYRSYEKQIEILAESEGGVAAQPGYSEHETGLGIDVYVNGFAGGGFLDCDEGMFVNKNCQDYGFIIRYPYNQKEVTGFGYEPWHIRYVGLPHSKIIAGRGLTLEGYMKILEVGKSYRYGDYIISRQSGDGKLLIPSEYETLSVSPDNCGNYIITAKIS